MEFQEDGEYGTTLNFTYRNNDSICNFVNSLYPEREYTNFVRKSENESDAVMIINKADVEKYLQKFNPMQLREKNIFVNNEYPYYNFGESKGLEFQRALIYQTQRIWDWIINNNSSSLK